MKKLYTLICVATLGLTLASAASLPVGTKKGSFLQYNIRNIQKEGSNLVTDVTMDFMNVKLPRHREVVLTPYWCNGTDSVFFESFSIAGRSNYIYDLRNGQLTTLLYKGWGKDRGELSKQSVTTGIMPYQTGTEITQVEKSPSTYDLKLITPYEPWMESATFGIEVVELGCASCGKSMNNYDLATTDFRPREYVSEFLYVSPVAEAVKSREVSGRAYIDFKVNQTVILPDFRNNSYEISKIVSTIDSVKNDKDITVTSLAISGTASPEGSYSNNVRLAQGRTKALAEYVRILYSFPQGFIKESYEPVDWKGLSEWLQNNTIEHREEILAIVNGDLPPEQRNAKIKNTYPQQYKWLLENVYPSLRHSDYAIEFNIRTYTQVDEILEVMQTSPQKLSLAELFTAARSQEEGSPLYNEAMEIAVRMFPKDETANLNAGVASLKRNDFEQAKRYLDRAGNSPEVEYNRAVMTALQGKEAEAYAMFLKLEKCDNAEVREKAMKAAQQLAEKINFKGNFTTLM